MYLADYHVHSRVSPDASASMTALAEAAIRLGFQELCFTDHVEPIRFGTTQPREGGLIRRLSPRKLLIRHASPIASRPVCWTFCNRTVPCPLHRTGR